MKNKPIKSELWFCTPCIKCGKILTITFDDDGDVEGNVMQCGVTYSGIFASACTPLGLHPEDIGGFKHIHC